MLANGHEESRGWPYAYSVFSNGVRVPDVARQLYRALGAEARRFGDPFDAGHQPSFYDWLRADVAGRGKAGVSRLWYETYCQDPELPLMYPDPLERNREAFRAWILEIGAGRASVRALRAADVPVALTNFVDSGSAPVQAHPERSRPG